MKKGILTLILAAFAIAVTICGCNGNRTYGNETYHYYYGSGMVTEQAVEAAFDGSGNTPPPVYSKTSYKVTQYTVVE